MSRSVSIATIVGLAASLLAAAAPAGAAPQRAGDDLVGRSFEMRGQAPALRRAGASEQLISATATFSAANRATGMPTSTAPQHQFAPIAQGGSLSVTIDYGYHWQTDALIYHYSLPGTMLDSDSTSRTSVRLGFGVQAGTTCTIQEVTTDSISRYLPSFLLYDNKATEDLAAAKDWSCAVLLVDNGDPASTPYDAFVAPLDVVTAAPELSVTAPKRDRLVKKTWTRIPVRVANAAAEGIDARDVAVTGAGKGVKVRPASFGSLDGQDDIEGHVWARLTKPRATLKLAVTEKGDVVGNASVKLRQRPVPAPPRAGTWSANGVDFTVRGGKVRGFRIFTQTTCGGYPDIPTTTSNTYDFPTVRIPRNNEVVGSDGKKGGDAAYSAYLELEFVSPTKARGTFSYYGPARCTAFDSFTARRKG